ncbi:MAG: hypothetical protein IJQ85_05565 [Selenomonadaceae bacterium]|nr:hypothetical protein [Selenomonadaceae bacterium]
MNFKSKIALLTILAAIQFPCAGYAAEEDKELSLIAAEQNDSDEELDEINPALKESLSTERTQETNKEIKERKKKLKQTRKEKEKTNEQKLKDSANQKDRQRGEESIVIEQTPQPKPQPSVEPKPQPIIEQKPEQKPQPIIEQKPEQKPQPIIEQKPEQKPQPIIEPKPEQKPQPIIEQKPEQKPQPIIEQKPEQKPQPIIEPKPEQKPQPIIEPKPQPKPQPITPTQPPPITRPSAPLPQTVETVALPDQKVVYANFAEVSRAVKFVPLYMPRKSGYEITAIYAGKGIAEIRYGRRWEPTVSLTVRTHKRAEGEALQDISGVTGVKWRVDTTTGTTIYVAKISETRQVAAWAVGHYTFSAQAENLSYAGFHSLVADELVELSTHYYLDL